MSRKDLYTCDMCGQDDFAREIFGVVYTGDSSIYKTAKNQSATHICDRCIKSIKEWKENE